MPEFGLAGAEIMCENLVKELNNNGVEVIVVSLYSFHSVITSRIENSGIRIIYLDKKPGLDLTMVTKLIHVFKEEQPDVIHTHRYVMQYAIPAAIYSGVKVRIHTVHNIAKKENTKIARRLNFLFYTLCSVVPVALSEEIKRTIIEEYHLSDDKVPVILNGIDLSNCVPKKDYSIKGSPKLLHIGRFSKQKNHIGLIESFELIKHFYPESVLQLIGDGEEKIEIEKLVIEKELTSSVLFLGLQKDVFSYLFNADLFLLPSLYEGVPMTLIEAMGTGLPIVATDVGGIHDMLVDRMSASLVTLDSNEIAEACIELLRDKNLRELYGKNAYRDSSKFSVNLMAKKYIELYSSQMKKYR